MVAKRVAEEGLQLRAVPNLASVFRRVRLENPHRRLDAIAVGRAPAGDAHQRHRARELARRRRPLAMHVVERQEDVEPRLIIMKGRLTNCVHGD